MTISITSEVGVVTKDGKELDDGSWLGNSVVRKREMEPVCTSILSGVASWLNFSRSCSTLSFPLAVVVRSQDG